MIRLSKPFIPSESFTELKKILKTGNLVQGIYVKQLEQNISDYLSVNHAIAVSSGTAALHLALIALEIGPGDEVIVPAFSFPATINVVELVGATPVLVDISLDDFCIDVKKIENAITNRTKAIIPVHEFGQSADLERITFIAKKYKIPIIEDAACALGSEFKLKKTGTYGILGCFSLHPRKAITSGEGGIIVTQDKNLAEKIILLRNHGITQINGKTDFLLPGFNYRLTDFQASLVLSQLSYIDSIISHRQKIAKLYSKYLNKIEWITIPKEFSERKMTYQTYHILINELNRDSLINHLKKNNIEVNYGAYALHCLKYYSDKYSFTCSDFPNSYYAYNQGLALPIGNHIKDKEVKIICNQIKHFSS